MYSFDFIKKAFENMTGKTVESIKPYNEKFETSGAANGNIMIFDKTSTNECFFGHWKHLYHTQGSVSNVRRVYFKWFDTGAVHYVPVDFDTEIQREFVFGDEIASNKHSSSSGTDVMSDEFSGYLIKWKD